MDDPSELDALFARLAGGDRDAFADAFRRLWGPMLRFCRGMLQHDADAEDAAQSAMEKVFARANQYDPSRRALPWALSLAAWECRTLRKRKQRKREVPSDSAPEPQHPNPEADYVKHDLLQAASAALETLTVTDREALLATFLEEAASVEGATLRKRRQRALTRLRDAFRRLYGLD